MSHARAHHNFLTIGCTPPHATTDNHDEVD